jgi:hypothetical protein
LQKTGLATAVQQEVARALDARLRDQKVVDIETSQAILTRLSDWAKLFGFFVGIPLALLFTYLGFVGIRTYSDFSARINKAKEEALSPLESTKAEAARIAQAYKDLDAQLQAVKQLEGNVQHLSEKVNKIEEAIKFKPSASLTPELKQNLSQAFNRFYTYLKQIGFPLTKNPPTAFVDQSKEQTAYYSILDNQIVLSPDFAPLKDAGLREYTFYGLNVARPGATNIGAIEGLESGLADYFPCSFNGRSEFGKEIFEAIAKRHPGTPLPSRNLDNHRSFNEIQVGLMEEHDIGNIWGSAFWQIRTSIGQTETDRLLLAAWKSFAASESFTPATFAREIMKQDTLLYSGAHVKQIQSVFESRDLHF